MSDDIDLTPEFDLDSLTDQITPYLPRITTHGTARIAQQILWIADGIDQDTHLLPGLIHAYQVLADGNWTGMDDAEVIDAIREDHSTWQRMHGRVPDTTHEALYAYWSGVCELTASRDTDAQARRRIVLLAMNEAGVSMRDLADLIGVASHNVVAKALTRARSDLASSSALVAFYEAINRTATAESP